MSGIFYMVDRAVVGTILFFVKFISIFYGGGILYGRVVVFGTRFERSFKAWQTLSVEMFNLPGIQLLII